MNAFEIHETGVCERMLQPRGYKKHSEHPFISKSKDKLFLILQKKILQEYTGAEHAPLGGDLSKHKVKIYEVGESTSTVKELISSI